MHRPFFVGQAFEDRCPVGIYFDRCANSMRFDAANPRQRIFVQTAAEK
jgi:hypothetical protein